MAKEVKSLGFSKAVITEENGEFVITEYTKDETLVYNLSEKIREWVGIEGVALTFKQDKLLNSEE